jgi:hypothetical protein
MESKMRCLSLVVIALAIVGCGHHHVPHPSDNSPLTSFDTKQMFINDIENEGTLSVERDMLVDFGTGADAGKVRFYSQKFGSFVRSRVPGVWESATGVQVHVRIDTTVGPDTTTLVFWYGSGNAKWTLTDPVGPG